jgi:hypothetical protein
LSGFVEIRRKGSTRKNVKDIVVLEDMIIEGRTFVDGLKCNHDWASTMEVSKAVAMAAVYVRG